LDEFDAGATDVRDVPANADASSFLDRERALLGQDADQFTTPADSKHTIVEDADDDLLGGGDSYQDTDGPAYQQFDSSFPDLEATDDYGPGGTITGATSFPPPFTSSEPIEESAVIQEWRATRDAEIARRDQISSDRKATTVNEARQAIDDFYESYNDKKEKRSPRADERRRSFSKIGITRPLVERVGTGLASWWI